jgi:signal transduction histidine kinase
MARGSLRVRLTALVTVAVGLALAAASVALVTSMSRTLVGEAEDAALAKVDAVAAALEAGQPVPEGDAPEHLTVIQVQDTDGNVLQKIPDTAAPGALAGLRDEVRAAREDALADEPRGARPSDEQVLAWRTVSTPDGDRVVLAVSRLGSVTRGVQLVVTSLLVATPLLTLFVGLLTWFAVGRALRPVEAIRGRAEVISHANLDERLPPPRTGDEVARLTETLNEMLDRIAEGARRQREFVSDASHELRTPLAAIRADLEVSLARPGAWPGVGHRLLADHQRLERLTGDLLLLARLDDHAPGRTERLRLDAVVAGELPALRRTESTVDLDPVTVAGNEPELARLVRNLLENADQHAIDRVAVRLHTEDGAAVLTVDDDGPGIPPDERDRVFDRFHRLDASRARTSGGAGLGLAMVRRIAHAHGGTVSVADAPLGGARFTVRLPSRPV